MAERTDAEWDYSRHFLKVPVGIVRLLSRHPIALALYLAIYTRVRWSAGTVMTSHGARRLEAGQAVFGRGELAATLACGESTIRSQLNRLRIAGILTIESTKAGTVATLVGYSGSADAAGPDQPTDRPSDRPTDRPRVDQRIDTKPTTNVDEQDVPDQPDNLDGLEGERARDALRDLRKHWEDTWRSYWRREPSAVVEWTTRRHADPLKRLVARRSVADIKRAIDVMHWEPPPFPTGRDVETLDKFFDKFEQPYQGKESAIDVAIAVANGAPLYRPDLDGPSSFSPRSGPLRAADLLPAQLAKIKQGDSYDSRMANQLARVQMLRAQEAAEDAARAARDTDLPPPLDVTEAEWRELSRCSGES